ncbi:HEPN domain-containing protein [Alcaligenes faecalis]
MSQSSRFQEMESRLTELRRNMLPDEFSPTGDYTDKDLDLARGYRLLVHAEIESYLEDIAKDTIIESIRNWDNNQKPSLTLISFLAAYHSGWNIDEGIENEEIIKLAKNRPKIKDSVKEAINCAQRQYIQYIKDNHGVKENNIKKLILPLGIQMDEIDGTWLATINSFGTNRGETAHNSKRATGQINPKDEYKTTQDLLDGLRNLDSAIAHISSK